MHGAGQATVVDLDDGAEGSRLAVEVRLPVPPAHNGERGTARRVVGDIQHAPQRGPHAERMEEVPRDHPGADRLAAGGRLRPQWREADHVREHGVAVAILRVVLQTKHVQRRIAGVPPRELHETAGIPNRQIAKQQRIDEAEGGGVGANGQRERGDRHRGEDRRPAERAYTVAEVLDEVLEPAQSALIAALLHYLRDAAGLQSRLAGGVLEREASPLQFVSNHVDVQAQLFLHLGVFRRLVERCPESAQPLADSSGHQLGSLRIACMVVTMRFHSRFSAASCFLPAGVSA